MKSVTLPSQFGPGRCQAASLFGVGFGTGKPVENSDREQYLSEAVVLVCDNCAYHSLDRSMGGRGGVHLRLLGTCRPRLRVIDSRCVKQSSLGFYDRSGSEEAWPEGRYC
jgi:hypothetical protein